MCDRPDFHFTLDKVKLEEVRVPLLRGGLWVDSEDKAAVPGSELVPVAFGTVFRAC